MVIYISHPLEILNEYWIWGLVQVWNQLFGVSKYTGSRLIISTGIWAIDVAEYAHQRYIIVYILTMT